jgi:hypothetical protein
MSSPQQTLGQQGPGTEPIQIPDNAGLVTWHYELHEQAQAQAQARTDCAQAGGRFSYPLK